MGFGGGVKHLVDAEVNLHFFAFEPASAALRQRRRLGGLRQTQRLTIECSGALLAAGGHGELDVIDSHYGHGMRAPKGQS
jgi:hypothetical protein